MINYGCSLLYLCCADTACSSSLIATHAARGQGVVTGAAAIVGGVNMMLLSATTAMFGAAGMLSPDGRCVQFTHPQSYY